MGRRLKIPDRLTKIGRAVSGQGRRPSLRSELQRATGLEPGEMENLYEFEFVDDDDTEVEPSMMSEAVKAVSECVRGLMNLPYRRRRKKAAYAAQMTSEMHEKMNVRVGEQEAKVDILNIKIAKSVAQGDRTMAKQREYINPAQAHHARAPA